jgi:hypothetical protein
MEPGRADRCSDRIRADESAVEHRVSGLQDIDVPWAVFLC